ncbi:lipopolysaccharide biosynthesis protein [Streptomyces sp. RKND-216]|uniref:lipopolysaccharide biosynthesis protein n=1 Tax=Streptomyces sp. RKND-216 TaxID=2562581 RepID=UPI001FF8A14D|nr:lipopolysaccharide biosynthesis protein [Streptomyces sp. RKND-216]
MREGAPGDASGRVVQAHDEPDLLREQFRQLLRYRTLITVGVALGVLAGLALALSRGDSYTASNEVALRPSTQAMQELGTDGEVSMGSERRTALSRVVSRQAAQDLGLPTGWAENLARDLQVTNPPNTVVLRFTYTAESPVEAAERANAFARAYLDFRQQETDDRIAHMIGSYKEQRKPLVEERDRLADELDTVGGGEGYDSVVSSHTSFVGQIADINSRISQLEALDTTRGRVVSEATAPEAPSGPGLVLLLVLGAFVGVGLGLLAAWVRLVFDPTVRSPGDVVRALRAPVLGVLPKQRRGQPEPLLAEGRLAEEYRSVAFRLAYDETFAQRRRLLVVAPRGGIDSVLAASVNLAAAFAEMGRDALLIEANLRTPVLRDQLHHADGMRPGWAESADDEVGDWPAGRRVPIDAGESGVFDLVPGRRVRNVPRALTSSSATRLISRAEARNSVLVVLAPAVLSYADAIALTDRVDAVLVVCDPREVRRDDLDRVRELVVGAGGVLLGAVLHSEGGGARETKGRAPRRQPAPGTSSRIDRTASDASSVTREWDRAGAREAERQSREPVDAREVGVDTVGLRIVDRADIEDGAPHR